MAVSLSGIGRFSSFLVIYIVGFLGWGSTRRKTGAYTQDNTDAD
jgi:hypothetical protein